MAMTKVNNGGDAGKYNFRVRLENGKRLVVVEVKDETYKVLAGSLKGVVKGEGHVVLEGYDGRTDEQECALRASKIIAAKIKAGYVPVDKEGGAHASSAKALEAWLKLVEPLSAKAPKTSKLEKSYAKAMAKWQTLKTAAENAAFVALCAELELKAVGVDLTKVKAYAPAKPRAKAAKKSA